MGLTNFIHQKLYERIVYQIRKHLIILMPALFGWLVLLAIPLLVRWLVNQMFPDFLNDSSLYPLMILFISTYYLSVGLFLFTYFIDFYLDLLVITNDRLINIKQRGLFSCKISEVDLYQIEDITSEVDGIFASFFNYGTLTIQTSGAMGHFVMENIPNPHALRQSLLNLAEEDRKFHQNK